MWPQVELMADRTHFKPYMIVLDRYNHTQIILITGPIQVMTGISKRGSIITPVDSNSRALGEEWVGRSFILGGSSSCQGSEEVADDWGSMERTLIFSWIAQGALG